MDVKRSVTQEQKRVVQGIQVPSFLQKSMIEDTMNETAQNLVEAVQQTKIESENDIKHLRDLESQAQAMDKQEQEATVRGISSDVMFEELLKRQMYYEQKINKMTEVLGDA